jgi:hypothetical protein
MSSGDYYQKNQQLINYNNASLIQNSYAIDVILKIKTGEEEVNSISQAANNNDIADSVRGKTRISDEINSIICQSCFWCASYISTTLTTSDSISITKCPSCIKGNIESIPIARNEDYRYEYDTKRGIIMKFFG